MVGEVTLHRMIVIAVTAVVGVAVVVFPGVQIIVVCSCLKLGCCHLHWSVCIDSELPMAMFCSSGHRFTFICVMARPESKLPSSDVLYTLIIFKALSYTIKCVNF